MKPPLLLYLRTLEKRWWEYSKAEKELLCRKYRGFIGVEDPSVVKEIRTLSPTTLILFSWMPQLVPQGTEFHEWNPMRRKEGWDHPKLLRDIRDSVVSDPVRSYGLAWLDCSIRDTVDWLLDDMAFSWDTKLLPSGYDGFTLEVASFLRPYRQFFPEDLELRMPWATFESSWTLANHGFLNRLKAKIPGAIIVTGSDGLAGDVGMIEGRLVEDFMTRGTWLEDTETKRSRSIRSALTDTLGTRIIVKQSMESNREAGYAAAAFYDTYYTVMTPGKTFPIEELGFESSLPGWDLSVPLAPVQQDGRIFFRDYQAGRLEVLLGENGQPYTDGVRFLPTEKPAEVPPRGCLVSLLPFGGLLSKLGGQG